MQGIGSLISALGEGQDTEAIHLTKGELKKVQKTLGQKGKRNPLTGLLGFWSEADQDAMEDAMDQADADMGDSYGSNVGEGGYTGPGSPAATSEDSGYDYTDEGYATFDDPGYGIGGLDGSDTQTDAELDAWNKAQFQELDESGILDSKAALEAGMNELGNMPMSFWDEVSERGFWSTLFNHLPGMLPGVNVQAYHNDPEGTQDRTTWGIGELIGDVLSLGTGGAGFGILGMLADEQLSRPTTSKGFREMTAAREAGKSYGTLTDLDENPLTSLAGLVGWDESKLANLESPKGDPLEYEGDSDSDSDNKLRRALRMAKTLDDQANIDPEPEVPSNIDLDMVDLIDRKNIDRENWYRRYQEGGEPIFSGTEFAGPAYYEGTA